MPPHCLRELMQRLQKHSVYPKSGRALAADLLMKVTKIEKAQTVSQGLVQKARFMCEVKQGGRPTRCLCIGRIFSSSFSPQSFLPFQIQERWAEFCCRQYKIPFSSQPVELLSFQFCIYSSVLKFGAIERWMLEFSPKSRAKNCQCDASTTGVFFLPEIKHHGGWGWGSIVLFGCSRHTSPEAVH